MQFVVMLGIYVKFSVLSFCSLCRIVPFTGFIAIAIFPEFLMLGERITG